MKNTKRYVSRVNSKGAIEVEVNQPQNEWDFRDSAFKLADEAIPYQLTVHCNNLINTHGRGEFIKFIVDIYLEDIKRHLSVKRPTSLGQAVYGPRKVGNK
jgi:hypothetical protein